jgi:hypothetical protein
MTYILAYIQEQGDPNLVHAAQCTGIPQKRILKVANMSLNLILCIQYRYIRSVIV